MMVVANDESSALEPRIFTAATMQPVRLSRFIFAIRSELSPRGENFHYAHYYYACIYKTVSISKRAAPFPRGSLTSANAARVSIAEAA